MELDQQSSVHRTSEGFAPKREITRTFYPNNGGTMGGPGAQPAQQVYFPFGKGGGGAPMRDQHGQIVATRRRNEEGAGNFETQAVKQLSYKEELQKQVEDANARKALIKQREREYDLQLEKQIKAEIVHLN